MSDAVGMSGVELGTGASPFLGRWDPRPTPVALIPLVVAAAVLLVSRTVTAGRLELPWLLALGYGGSLAWALALAAAGRTDLADSPFAVPTDYLAAVAAAGDNPLEYLDRLTGPGPDASATTASGHPPGPVLLLWALTRLGIDGSVPLGLLLTAVGAATVPLVTVAVRSLCHETAARRLVPVLALAPWAAWTVASPAAVTATLAAAGVAVGVIGSEPGRRPRWALASGLLLGLTGLFGYPAPWLGTAVAATYFVRRRPLLNAITGLGALVPLFAVYAIGFSWPESLGMSRSAALGGSAGLGGSAWATWAVWCVLDMVVLVVVAGPVLVRAARRIRLTPGWPFLVGSGAAALFSLAAGLAQGGVEWSWLPLLPWLLVPALAPRPRPAEPGDTVRAGEMPVLLVAVGATAAVVLRVCLVPG
jgi:hypothetical protein